MLSPATCRVLEGCPTVCRSNTVLSVRELPKQLMDDLNSDCAWMFVATKKSTADNKKTFAFFKNLVLNVTTN